MWISRTAKLPVKICALSLFVGLAGCTVGPKYERADLVSLTGGRYAHEFTSGSDSEKDGSLHVSTIGSWWTRFNDPVTNHLVSQALLSNLDLSVAAANVLESRALVRATTGQQLPVVSAGFIADRGFSGEPNGVRDYSTSLVLSTSVSWQADLFGRLRRQLESVHANLGAKEADYLALAHSIVAEVVRRRADISVAQRRLDLAEEILKSRHETLRTIDRRYQEGVAGVSAIDVRLARENVAAAEANFPASRRELERLFLSLDVLLGQSPGQVANKSNVTMPLPDAPRPPLDVPAALLDRRPDLRASEFRVKLASAGIGVAVADLYPDLTLGATIGYDSRRLEHLFDPNQLFASMVGELAVRLFEGGRLRAEVDAAEARYAALANQYASDVLNAIREVNDALVIEFRVRQQLNLILVQVAEAQAAESLVRDRYARGISSLLVVLDTERRRRAAEDLVIQLQGQVWNARVDLHLALGGDWGINFSQTSFSEATSKGDSFTTGGVE